MISSMVKRLTQKQSEDDPRLLMSVAVGYRDYSGKGSKQNKAAAIHAQISKFSFIKS